MVINCEKLANDILEKVKQVPNKKELAIITIGYDPASESYVKGKKKDCDKCGIKYRHIQFGECAQFEAVAATISECNKDDNVGGIIVQLPTPYSSAINDAFTLCIDSGKDVDGFKLFGNFSPCTPEGIIHILNSEYDYNLSGKNVLLIGRGKLVCKPLIDMLLKRDCTVTVTHSKTKHIEYFIKGDYDIIITGVNKVHSIDLAGCRAKTIIDAGIGYDENGHLCGNCYNSETNDPIYHYTPVPKGVGLLTRAILMAHIAKATDPDFEY